MDILDPKLLLLLAVGTLLLLNGIMYAISVEGRRRLGSEDTHS